MLTKNSILSAFSFSLLSLVVSNPSYGLAIDLTTFNQIGDTSLLSNQATINSGTLSTVFTGGGIDSLEEFLNLDPNDFATVIPYNVYGSAIKKSLSVNVGDVLSFDYTFNTTEPDVAFVTIGSTITPLTSASAFRFTFTTSGLINFGVGVVDVDDSIGQSTLIVTNADINTAVPFEFSPAMGLLALGIWAGRKKAVVMINSWKVWG